MAICFQGPRLQSGDSYSVILRCWFKGADTSTLCVFLEARLSQALATVEEDSKSYLNDMIHALSHANSFMTCLYGADLWLQDEERNKLLHHGVRTMEFFKKMAAQAYTWGLTRWKLQPKFHFFSEVLYSMNEERTQNIPTLSPLAYCTQCDEDFVGRVATASRVVSSRTVHVRTMERYMLSLKVHS